MFSEDYRNKTDGLCRSFGPLDAFRCLKCDGSVRRISFNELYESILSFKDTLEKLQLHPGDRVAILENRNYRALPLFLCLSYYGITSVIPDTALPADLLKAALDRTDVSAIFFNPEKYSGFVTPEISAVAIDSGYEIISVAKHKQVIPGCTEDVAILFSSGTTAEMKAVRISYESLLGSCTKIRQTMTFTQDSDYLFLFPICHISGLASGVANLFFGGALDMIEEFSAQLFAKAIAEFNPKNFAMIPGILDTLVKKLNSELEKKSPFVRAYYKLSGDISELFLKAFGIRCAGKFLMRPFSEKLFGKRIEYIASGAGHCNPETAGVIMRMGIVFANFYASTECGVPIAVTDMYDRFVPDTVGRVKYADIKINTPDETGIGEIFVKSNTVTPGYFNDPELTCSMLEDGYFRTGDLGYIDGKNYLHVTGRVKESIILRNGKKISPNDIEAVISPLCGCPVTVCGVRAAGNSYDDIYIFAEGKQSEQTKRKILEIAREKFPKYQICDVVITDEIPKTRLGKPKRYMLQELITGGKSDSICAEEESGEQKLIGIISARCSRTVKPDDTLNAGLGLDSLAIFDLCADIEKSFGVSVSDCLQNDMTVGKLYELICERQLAGEHDGTSGPERKTGMRQIKFKIESWLVRRAWKIEARNLQNIPKDSPCIFCANHESLLDAVWLLSSIPGKYLKSNRVCCLAKAERLPKKGLVGFLADCIATIPIESYNLTSGPLSYAKQWLKDGNVLLIFPEGTRSPDGKLGQFRNGAAALALASGTPLLPVCITGGHTVFPPDSKRPKFFNHGKRYRAVISFGNPILPQMQSADEITKKLFEAISSLKNQSLKGKQK